VTEKSEAIACARKYRPSQLTGWWIQKNNRKKWRAEEEERHKGSGHPTDEELEGRINGRRIFDLVS
jgi:hypothetical protein